MLRRTCWSVGSLAMRRGSLLLLVALRRYVQGEGRGREKPQAAAANSCGGIGRHQPQAATVGSTGQQSTLTQAGLAAHTAYTAHTARPTNTALCSKQWPEASKDAHGSPADTALCSKQRPGAGAQASPAHSGPDICVPVLVRSVVCMGLGLSFCTMPANMKVRHHCPFLTALP